MIRDTELHRRRARRQKLAKLRRRYAAATTEAARRAVVEKVSRVARWLSPEQFLAPLGSAATTPVAPAAPVAPKPEPRLKKPSA